MKITVISTKKPIVFFPGTILRFNLSSPIFDESGSHSFPFEIPVFENQLALGFVEKMNKSDDDWEIKIPVYIETNSLDCKNAYLFVGPGTLKYDCSLVIAEGKINSDMSGKKISEFVDLPVNMGESDSEFIEFSKNLLDKTFPDADFIFPIMDIEKPYSNESISNGKFYYINYYWWFKTRPGYNFNRIGGNSEPIINETSFVPCPFVFTILKNIFINLGLNLKCKAFEDTDINQLMFITNKSLDKYPDDVSNDFVKADISEIYNIRLYQDGRPEIPAMVKFSRFSPLPLQNPYNQYDEYGYFTSNRREVTVYQFHYKLRIFNPNPNVPEVKFRMCVGLLDQINPSPYQMPGNGQLYSVPYNQEIEIEDVINFTTLPPYNLFRYYLGILYSGSNSNYWYPYLQLRSGLLDILPLSDTMLVNTNKKFNLKNHIPDITFKQLFDDLRNLFGLIRTVDKDDVYIDLFKDIYNSTPIMDLTHYMLENFEKETLESIKSVSFPEGYDYKILNNPGMADDHILPYSTVPGDILFVRPEGQYYSNESDEFYNFSWDKFKPYNIKLNLCDKGNEITLNAKIPDVVKAYAKDPYIEENSKHAMVTIKLNKNLISPFNRENNDSEYMLAFWRGMVHDEYYNNDFLYPLVSPWKYNILNYNIGNQDLSLGSLYQKYTKQYFDMFNTKNNLYLIELDLPQNILKKLRFNKTYTINGIKFIIKKIDFETDVFDRIKQPVTLQIVKL